MTLLLTQNRIYLAHPNSCYTGELLAMEFRTQIAGVTAVVDASDFGFKHFKSLSLQDLKHAAMFAQVMSYVVKIIKLTF